MMSSIGSALAEIQTSAKAAKLGKSIYVCSTQSFGHFEPRKVVRC